MPQFYKIVVVFSCCIFATATILLFRSHIKQFKDNLCFRYIYHNTVKHKPKTMRLTQAAYIQGLNHGYALAKAQYENRCAIIYKSSNSLICSECNYPVEGKNYCPNCGCRFTSTQQLSR